MALVTMKEILQDASKRSYGVGAFNINNLEFLQAIIEAAEEENSPVIIAISEGAMKYGWVELLSTMVKTAAVNAKVPVALHLDHGKNFDKILAAIRYGFTSIMIDASDKPYEENVRLTKEVVKLAHPLGITVEAELGRLLGKEDEVESDVAIYTDPDSAKRFVEETEIDALAVAVGTSHGAYKFKGEAKLDIERIRKINSLTGVPLVLHGASGVPHQLVEEAQKYGAVLKGAKGVPDEEIKRAIEAGIRKINIDTDLRISFLLGVRKYLSEHPEIFDPRKYLGEGRAKVKETIKKKMQLFGSSGKA